MGALVVNMFLSLNPELSSRLAGVIYCAPLFGLYNKKNFFLRALESFFAVCKDDMILLTSFPYHRISRNKQYVRQVITQKKVIPLLTAQLSSSINKNIDKAENLASKVQYPYLLLLGEKDTMVDNLSALRWHEKTTSKDKHLQVL